MANPRIRRDVWKLDQWDPTLSWYAKAIAEMQKRPLNDSAGWRYQAAIHRYRRNEDALKTPADKLLSTADQQRFWTQCQHNSWFFLPWHRMYLAMFEQIVASTIATLGGPPEWALPYWNYSDPTNAKARSLPPAFYATETPDGEPNPLRVADRDPGWNNGKIIADDQDADVTRCLQASVFAASAGESSFGGGRTAFNHGSGIAGLIDAVPHGSIHIAIGGWMGGFSTAGLDPIFWLHHANIDRLWSVWLRRDPQHSNPAEQKWLTALKFEFHDATGRIIALTPSQVVDTTGLPSPYKYEDETDPLAETLGPGRVSPEISRREAMPVRRIPEMVAATNKPIVLAGERTITTLSASTPQGPARGAAEAGAALPKIYLNIENITSEGKPTSYAVYVDLPPNANPAEHPELLAGTLPMFGVSEASRSDEDHPGSGLHYSLEVTDVVKTLQQRNAWDPRDIRLTFVPKHRGPEPEAGFANAVANPIHVGRVSLYFG